MTGKMIGIAALTAAIGLTAGAEAFDPIAYVKAEIAKGDQCVEAQPDEGMSQTKVKSRMYASILPIER